MNPTVFQLQSRLVGKTNRHSTLRVKLMLTYGASGRPLAHGRATFPPCNRWENYKAIKDSCIQRRTSQGHRKYLGHFTNVMCPALILITQSLPNLVLMSSTKTLSIVKTTGGLIALCVALQKLLAQLSLIAQSNQ